MPIGVGPALLIYYFVEGRKLVQAVPGWSLAFLVCAQGPRATRIPTHRRRDRRYRTPFQTGVCSVMWSMPHGGMRIHCRTAGSAVLGGRRPCRQKVSAESPAVRRPRAECTTAIADYAVIGDCRSAALISRDGGLDWLCLPHFSSPAIFGALLNQPPRREAGWIAAGQCRRGRFRIRPVGSAVATRRYLPGTRTCSRPPFARTTARHECWTRCPFRMIGSSNRVASFCGS